MPSGSPIDDRAPGPDLPLDPAALAAVLDDVEVPRDQNVAARAAELARPDSRWVAPALGLLDLTSLSATDTPGVVRGLCERAAAPGPGLEPVAAVCVWPDLVAEAAAALSASPVRIASVAGAFPSARSPLAVRVAEVEAAVAAGADEVDVVIDRGALAEGRDHDAYRQLVALRAAAPDATCKVILETGSLPDARAIARAAWVAMLAGADMLKTSTGKDGPGADPVSVLVLVEQAVAFEQRYGRPVGVKAAGGIRTAEDATRLLALVAGLAGPAWVAPDRLRLGASSLLEALVAELSASP